MSDLGLAVDYSSVLEAKLAVTNLEDSYGRMVQTMIAENNRLKVLNADAERRAEAEIRTMKKIEAEAQKHYDSLVAKALKTRMALRAQKEKEEVAAFAAMRREAEEENRNIDRIAAEKQKAIDEEIKERERLKASYESLLQRLDPQYRALQQERQIREQLNAAIESNIGLTNAQIAAAKRLIDTQFSGAEAYNQFGAKALWSGKNLGYHGQMLQQAGYQFQDLIVQIQSGTSAFVALGQQGPQFAGIFGPGGAVVGAIIALAAVAGGLAYNLLGVGKSFEDMAKEVSSAMGDLESSTGRLEKAFQQDLASAISVATGELSSFLDKWNEIETKAFVDAFKPIREDLTGPLDTFIKAQEKAKPSPLSGKTALRAPLPSGIDDSDGARVLAVAKELDAIYSSLESDTIPGLVGKFVEANTLIERSVELSDKEKEAAQERLVTIAKEIGIADQLNSIQTQGAEDRKAWLEQLAEIEATTASTKLFFIDQERAYWQAYADAQVTKGQALADMNKEAAAKEKERLVQAYNAYADSYEAGMKLERLDLASSLAGATANAEGLANAMIRALGAAEAIRMMFSWGPTTTYGEVFQGPMPPEGFVAERERLRGMRPEQMDDPDLDGLPGVTKDTKKGGKGGGGSKKTGGDRLAQLEQEYQQKLKIAKLSGEQLQYEQTYQAVVKALGEDQSKYSEDFINQKTAELAEVQKLIDLENDRKDLLQSVEGAFEDMFMSMADGTKSVKEAFTDMARSIVAELWKVLVVKQAVNAVSGFIGGIGSGGLNLGGTPSNSVVSVNDAVISPSGQIISTSPEDFLIATKKPQNLANTLGGNGNNNTVSEGGVTVNQTFQITGSDQATVQQALVRAMPAIVTATKSAIVDSRRRGSSDLRGSF